MFLLKNSFFRINRFFCVKTILHIAFTQMKSPVIRSGHIHRYQGTRDMHLSPLHKPSFVKRGWLRRSRVIYPLSVARRAIISIFSSESASYFDFAEKRTDQKAIIESPAAGCIRLNPPPSVRTGHLLFTKGGFGIPLLSKEGGSEGAG